jgi:hypothetical protein
MSLSPLAFEVALQTAGQIQAWVAIEAHPYKTRLRSFVGAALRGRPSAIISAQR